MSSSTFTKGTRIQFRLIRPYNEEDIKFGCDPRVNGMTGTIQSIWDLKEMCIVKLDNPLIGVHGEKTYEYWEYTYNMVKLPSSMSENSNLDKKDKKDNTDYRKSWKELKSILIKRYDKLSEDTETSNNMIDYTRLHVITDILQLMDELDETSKK